MRLALMNMDNLAVKTQLVPPPFLLLRHSILQSLQPDDDLYEQQNITSVPGTIAGGDSYYFDEEAQLVRLKIQALFFKDGRRILQETLYPKIKITH